MDMNKVIGIVGTGKIGGSIAKLLVKNGYQVILVSKNNKTIMAPKNCTTRMKKGDIILH
jgi:predicted dinucleotide-binding enzyme